MTGPQYPGDQPLAHGTETSADAEALHYETIVRAVNDALGALEALGSTDAIAAHLAENKATGTRVKADECPVSNYVRAATGHHIAVCRDHWMMNDRPYLPRPMTPIVGEFISMFDDERYPELDRDRLAHPAAQ